MAEREEMRNESRNPDLWVGKSSELSFVPIMKREEERE